MFAGTIAAAGTSSIEQRATGSASRSEFVRGMGALLTCGALAGGKYFLPRHPAINPPLGGDGDYGYLRRPWPTAGRTGQKPEKLIAGALV
jgi:hypothetical protein